MKKAKAAKGQPTSITISVELLRKAKAHMRKKGYESFSKYVEFLIRCDLEENPAHFVLRDDGGVRYGRVKEENPFDPPKK